MGETILEWNDKDIEHYHARRMAMDSMLCRFKATYPAERIDSVRSLLEVQDIKYIIDNGFILLNHYIF